MLSLMILEIIGVKVNNDKGNVIFTSLINSLLCQGTRYFPKILSLIPQFNDTLCYTIFRKRFEQTIGRQYKILVLWTYLD